MNLLSFFKLFRWQFETDVAEEVLLSTFTVTELRLGRPVNQSGHNSIILLWRCLDIIPSLNVEAVRSSKPSVGWFCPLYRPRRPLERVKV
jgi:hypothetical protein